MALADDHHPRGQTRRGGSGRFVPAVGAERADLGSATMRRAHPAVPALAARDPRRDRRRSFRRLALGVLAGGAIVLLARADAAEPLPGSGPRLQPARFDQADVADGRVSFDALRRRGMIVFSTPFDRADGYGDGPMNPGDPTLPGGRPTLQGNGTFLRVNGLDGQTCLECHSIASSATVPMRFGIGGSGGSVTNALFLPRHIDVDDQEGHGFAGFDGRFINPPFLFGAGGVELVAKEMTRDLQALAAQASRQPGIEVRLVSKGIDFGTLSATPDGRLDTSGVRGVGPDLVVRPFGRKGEFATVRSFDLVALQFHFGMQPVETVGEGNDADGDGVVDEMTVADLSALSAFVTTLPPPVERGGAAARAGALVFVAVGCATCHVPELDTATRILTYGQPEVPTDPDANVYAQVDLAAAAHFLVRGNGLRVPLFADLKRHDMGPALAESFGSTLDSEFTTARLWGVADSGPYLHDGRATTLLEAIRLHGGEAQSACDHFGALPERQQAELLEFLRSLHTPDILPPSAATRSARDQGE